MEVGSFEEAKRAVDAGVDAIIVQGLEAGGHVIGQVSCLLLLQVLLHSCAIIHLLIMTCWLGWNSSTIYRSSIILYTIP